VNLPKTARARGGQLVFALIVVLFATFLLLMLTTETRFTPGKQLFAQPRFWPGAAVIGMLLFSLGYLCSHFRTRSHHTGTELLLWLRSLEYLLWFMAYVYSVPVIGYLLATLVFMLLLVFRLGYRSVKMLSLALVVGLIVVVVFKSGLSVRIPGGAIYEYLPDALRNFMITNF